MLGAPSAANVRRPRRRPAPPLEGASPTRSGVGEERQDRDAAGVALDEPSRASTRRFRASARAMQTTAAAVGDARAAAVGSAAATRTRTLPARSRGQAVVVAAAPAAARAARGDRRPPTGATPRSAGARVRCVAANGGAGAVGYNAALRRVPGRRRHRRARPSSPIAARQPGADAASDSASAGSETSPATVAAARRSAEHAMRLRGLSSRAWRSGAPRPARAAWPCLGGRAGRQHGRSVRASSPTRPERRGVGGERRERLRARPPRRHVGRRTGSPARG